MNDLKLVDDEIVFADDHGGDDKVTAKSETWKVMLVDDEVSIHDVTRMALDGFTFADKKLEFISAYSGEEAKAMIRQHPDTAVMLLDVVMENDRAGLEVAKYIREEAKNKLVRIVLRTGQPGQAPERKVITDYDINDYKEKTELTMQKLFTLMYSSLRSYRDIIALENNRRGLGRVINASSNIFELKSLGQFTTGVLEQLTALLHLDNDAVYCHGLAASHLGDTFPIVAGIGDFSGNVGDDASKALDQNVLAEFFEAIESGGNIYRNDHFIGYFKGCQGNENLLYLKGIRGLSDIDKNLIEVFTKNVAIAYENVHLHQDLEETQREIVYMLGEAVESRSKETGNHVKRVAEISKLLAQKYGIDENEAEIIKLASPLHDIGKIAIPDAILNKPGKLDAEEWEVMKSHAAIGYDMLKRSKRQILQASATIANEHHEKWDGSGYPHGRKGEDIHIYGRITALADVFDALGSDRCYKKAWPLDKVLALIKEESGKHFDPKLVDILIDNIDQVLAIRDNYVDVMVA